MNNATHKELLIEHLLSTNCFIKNSEFFEYIDLIVKSSIDNTVDGQIHHIVPRCYFSSINKPIDNSDLNTVKLSYK